MAKTNVAKLNVGDRLSRISFMEVLGKEWGGIIVKNEEGLKWSIESSIIEQECYSTQVTDEETVSKTVAAEILSHARDAIITVHFNKQATADTIKSNISKLAKMTEAKAKKELTTLLKGEERTLTGYVVGSEPLLGRTMMIDLNLPKEIKNNWDSRTRQVDHRSIQWLVYKNVLYKVK